MRQNTPRHFLDIHLLGTDTLRGILDTAHAMKRSGKRTPEKFRPSDIENTVLVMIFEKPSTRTRVSFDVGMRQLGGQTVMLNHTDLQLGRGETVADTARVLSRYADAIMLRANDHQTLLEFSENSSIPLINGLTDYSHPCQIMADIVTYEESKGPISGSTIAWVGDGNNVATSWMHAAVKFDFELRIGCPKKLSPAKEVVAWVKKHNGRVSISDSAREAVAGADCVVTDTWVSMGQKDARLRKALLAPYAVTQELMQAADPDAIFMHCLPAYRGNEVTTDVLEGPQSVVFDEAENRLHAQKAILSWCLGAGLSG
ncbi:MAG: ornithine carbamoyltransferase [Alphaproteobacteria bacterium]|nr:ornithine carbamoyltransferase [Alphaproteobacteria bacterium]